MTFRSRRLLWARWERLKRWEFWPVWAIYLPVLVSWLWHAARLKGLTLWAGCNPGMLASGVAMEKKGDVLDSFREGGSGVKVARYRRVATRADDAFDQVLEFMHAHELTYPVVLKPDLGQRGQGVEIVKDEASARRWVAHCEESFLVQELVGGLEFGVHWAKFPGEPKGMIRSICGKHPQKITGDGKRTLEELIVADDRAVLMSRYYLSKYEEFRSLVLPEGEIFTLAPIGTHSRGAIFTDERHLVTEELREVFDEFGARFPGFNFGRYDVKVPSVDDFQAGRNIVVLELNGVMGEPAHIYQPGYSWRKGMMDLCQHFKTAAEIGLAWRRRGISPPEPGDLLDLIRQHCENDYLEVDEFDRKT